MCFRLPFREPAGSTPGDWTAVLKLKPGDELVSALGVPLVVDSIDVDDAPTRVYSLEVEGLHSFAVGQLAAWVHNAHRHHKIMKPWRPCGCHDWLEDFVEFVDEDFHKWLHSGKGGPGGRYRAEMEKEFKGNDPCKMSIRKIKKIGDNVMRRMKRRYKNEK